MNFSDEAAVLQQSLDEARQRFTAEHEWVARLRSAWGGPDSESLPKKVYSFLGPPGCGKSVLLKKLRNRFSLEPVHMGTFARSLGDVSPENEERSATGELLEGYDERLLERISGCRDAAILLDGFPRSIEQAEKLLLAARRDAWTPIVVHLSFPEGAEVRFSLSRQHGRLVAKSKGGEIDREEERRAILKIKRASEIDVFVVEALRLAGVEVIELDALKGTSKVFAALRQRMELDIRPGPGSENEPQKTS
jgi:adenylate kinase family enzyme